MKSHLERYQVLAAGVSSLVLALGVARFSYTPLLPLMQHQARLGMAAAGWLASLNYVGYLSGALLTSLMSDIVLKDRLYRLGLIVGVLTTLLMGVTTDVALWAISRYLAGLGSAMGMVLGTGLVMSWLVRHEHRRELGIHFSGIGLGIALSAAAVLLMNRLQMDWRAQWYVFAALGAVLLLPALGWLPAPEPAAVTRSGQAVHDCPPSPMFLRLFMAAYFCAGVGYVVSATFIVAIVDRLPAASGHGTITFLVIGLAATPACALWDRMARRTGELNALILAGALQIAGILLPVIGDGWLPTLAGAVLFGATAAGMVSLVLSMAARFFPTRPARMMGKVTLWYGAAQVVAPALTASLASRSGSYAAGLYLAAAVMAVGTVLFAVLRAQNIQHESKGNTDATLHSLEVCGAAPGSLPPRSRGAT
jgi:MFS family permease